MNSYYFTRLNSEALPFIPYFPLNPDATPFYPSPLVFGSENSNSDNLNVRDDILNPGAVPFSQNCEEQSDDLWDISRFDTTPCVLDISSPVLSEVSSEEYCSLNDTVSYPITQLMIDRFAQSFRLHRNAHGGSILIYVRSDIPRRELNKHTFCDNIEGIFVEIIFENQNGSFSERITLQFRVILCIFENIVHALDIYTHTYDKILLAGDFNAEENEYILGNFMELYHLRNLVKEKTCFKSIANPLCVDLFLTNCYRSFQSTKVVSTGISDCHKMIVTVLKTTFKKAKPKEISYRCYKHFDNAHFGIDLRENLANCTNCSEYQRCFLGVLNAHAPLKKKIVRANEVPCMMKTLNKSIATRSRLENHFYKDRTDASCKAYKKQKPFVGDFIKECKKYYTNLDIKKIADSRKFWKTVKPFLSDKGISKTNIILIEGEIIQEDIEVAKVLSNSFSNAVKELGVQIPSEYLEDVSIVSDDPIDKIVKKYDNHPSIILITENVDKGDFSFNTVTLADVEKVVASLDSKKASTRNSIPTPVLKENRNICCEPLTNIINSEITNSPVDSCLKRADVTPIHKAEEITNKNNYRNVSMLSTLSKIFETFATSNYRICRNKTISLLVWLSKGIQRTSCVTIYVGKMERIS